MKKRLFNNSYGIRVLALMVLSTFIWMGCSGDNETGTSGHNPPVGVDDDTPPNDDDTPPATTNYYKLVRVENFGYDLENGNQFEDKATLYYNLIENKEAPSSLRKTSKWDIAFSGLYSSFMSGNNGTDSKNFGYGTSNVGGIYIVEKPFDEVTDIPDDGLFKTGSEIYGTDENGDFGQGKGWYLYDFSGTIVRDGSSNNQHIAYALGDALKLKNGSTVPARTLIVKTAKGDYAKIKMISVYKNIFNRENYTKEAEKMYFTFEYVVVPKGSTRFEIK